LKVLLDLLTYFFLKGLCTALYAISDFRFSFDSKKSIKRCLKKDYKRNCKKDTGTTESFPAPLSKKVDGGEEFQDFLKSPQE
jgi:hypothetical protein